MNRRHNNWHMWYGPPSPQLGCYLNILRTYQETSSETSFFFIQIYIYTTTSYCTHSLTNYFSSQLSPSCCSLVSSHDLRGRRSFFSATHPTTPPFRIWFYGNFHLSCSLSFIWLPKTFRNKSPATPTHHLRSPVNHFC